MVESDESVLEESDGADVVMQMCRFGGVSLIIWKWERGLD
jgi:hypothetical protein